MIKILFGYQFNTGASAKKPHGTIVKNRFASLITNLFTNAEGKI